MAGWADRAPASQRGYGSQWRKLRNATMARDLWLCQPCKRAGRVRTATEVDHIIPKHKGGEDDMGNTEAICFDCHATKTQRESAEAQGRTFSGTVKRRPTIGRDGWPIG